MCSAAIGTCAARAKPMAAPISCEIAWANISARSRIRAWTRSRSKALLWAELTDQVAKARRAAATAAATSCAVAQRDLRDRLLRRRVDDGTAGLPCGQDPLAVDEHAIQTAVVGEALDDGGVHAGLSFAAAAGFAKPTSWQQVSAASRPRWLTVDKAKAKETLM